MLAEVFGRVKLRRRQTLARGAFVRRSSARDPLRDTGRGMTTRRGRLAILTLLYFVQGLPYGFQATALGVYLREAHVSLTHIGLAGLLAVPWSLKALWAPFVDRHGDGRFGRRKSWIVPMQALLAASMCAAAVLPPDDGLIPLLVLVFLMNLFAATMDIAVDGLAVELLTTSELGTGNAAQVVGYKLGMLTGGGVLVWASGTIGWHGLFYAMATDRKSVV